MTLRFKQFRYFSSQDGVLGKPEDVSEYVQLQDGSGAGWSIVNTQSINGSFQWAFNQQSNQQEIYLHYQNEIYSYSYNTNNERFEVVSLYNVLGNGLYDDKEKPGIYNIGVVFITQLLSDLEQKIKAYKEILAQTEAWDIAEINIAKIVEAINFYSDYYQKWFNTQNYLLSCGAEVSNIDKNSLKTNILQKIIGGTDKVPPVLRLGIQSLPGCKFYINENNSPIYIGNSGIFELDLVGTGQFITSLKFDEAWVDSIFTNESRYTGYLIIDILYNTSNTIEEFYTEGDDIFG